VANVAAVRDRVKSRLQTVSGLNVYDFMPATPVVPAAIVSPAPGGFLAEVSMDGVEDLSLVVTVLVTKTVDQNAQNALDAYLSEGASNLADAIDSGSTADWDYAVSQPIRNYGRFVFGDGEAAQSFLGFEIPVMVGVS
jgi:hypothetical protein